MAARPTKIDNEATFTNKVWRAFEKYKLLFGGIETPWPERERKRLAASAAFEEGLHYPGSEVDHKVIAAIRMIGNSKKSEEQRVAAIGEAWKSYSRPGKWR